MFVYRLRGKVWIYPGQAGWHFITLPRGPAGEIKQMAGPRRGWGSVRVEATIGATSWQTSVFPHEGSYILPVKASVRKAEGIEAGADVAFELQVRV